jgi:peptidoglycan biosynthesis protein MviN/MurJ (putative lipid II flippase)
MNVLCIYNFQLYKPDPHGIQRRLHAFLISISKLKGFVLLMMVQMEWLVASLGEMALTNKIYTLQSLKRTFPYLFLSSPASTSKPLQDQP